MNIQEIYRELEGDRKRTKLHVKGHAELTLGYLQLLFDCFGTAHPDVRDAMDNMDRAGL